MNIKEIKRQEFNELNQTRTLTCPPKNHIIFNHFHELAEKYMNTAFIKAKILGDFNNQIKTLSKTIEELENDIDFYHKIEYKQKECDKDPNLNYTPTKADQKRFDKIDVDKCTEEINKLSKKIKIIKKWKGLLLGKDKLLKSVPKYEKMEDNLLQQTIDEYMSIYNMVTNIRPANKFKADMYVSTFKINDMLPPLTQELEKQIGLCIEENTKEYYYSDGNGRFVPFENNTHIYRWITNGATFIKAKDDTRRSGMYITSSDLFEKVPKLVRTTRTKDPNLIGFNNCFYNIRDNKIEKLQANIPLLPLRNTKTELYLDENIDGGAMEDIFDQCFSDQDRKALLAYLGCCLYDKGYTQRQESAFLLSVGGIGKTTFIKAICEIFYSYATQIVKKLSDEKFGLSMFGDNDCIVIDEIQGANKDFVEILKIISTGANLAVEKKNKDTINIPAEKVPRCWFVGNQFPKEIYDECVGEGVARRILVIIPKKSIVELGYEWQDLIEDNCKQWLVQQATKVYKELELDKKSAPILCISTEEKMDRIEKCTYPERYFMKEHFEVVYDVESKGIDLKINYLPIQKVQEFIAKEISDNMIEATVRKDNYQTFLAESKKAFDFDGAIAQRFDDGMHFVGIQPKTEKAKEEFKEEHEKWEYEEIFS